MVFKTKVKYILIYLKWSLYWPKTSIYLCGHLFGVGIQLQNWWQSQAITYFITNGQWSCCPYAWLVMLFCVLRHCVSVESQLKEKQSILHNCLDDDINIERCSAFTTKCKIVQTAALHIMTDTVIVWDELSVTSEVFVSKFQHIHVDNYCSYGWVLRI